MQELFPRFLRVLFLAPLAAAAALGACGSQDSPNPPSGSRGGSGGATGSGSGSGGSAGSVIAGSGGSGTPTGGSGGSSTGGGSATSGGGAGSGSTGGSGGTGPSTATGGNGGGGRAGSGGASGAGNGGNAGAGVGDAGTARFSFFATSFAALRRLSGNMNGFGGDLRFGKTNGLDGADEICRQIAETSMPGNGKTWRAFLSVTRGPNGTAVNAIDRVGNGPWYDRRGRLFTMNKAGLLQTRPQGADPIILNDLPNEDGVPNHNPDGTGIVDNHNFLTGSTAAGVLAGMNLADTCQDWTSSIAAGGRPRCGVTWPRASLVHWIYALNEGGCAPGATPPGADQGTPGTVGALGGYGGFYCFALTP